MQYTSNYHLSKPDSDDIINPTSRTGYNGNFDTLDTNLKSVSNKANANESNIAELQAQTGEDIPFESGSADSISDKITNLDNSVGNKPSGETDTLWDKIGILSNYSTTEQVIGKWIDGKPLYRRVLTWHNPTVNDDFSNPISNFKQLVSVRGYVSAAGDVKPIPAIYENADSVNGRYVFSIYRFSNTIFFSAGSYYTQAGYIDVGLIVEYTKRSD